MNEKIEKIISALERNRMKACFFETKGEVVDYVKSQLFEGCTIRTGGSVSLVESGVWELINRPEYRFADRSRAGISDEEKQEVLKGVVGCDFYFCSSNAVTENGELINVDGFSNRISAIAFGPKRVIMIVGINKIVPDVTAGILRVKTTAAPKNCVRLGIDNPCAKLGHCISLEKSDHPDMTDGCSKTSRICRNYLISSMQNTPDRITVILCGENLGY